MDFFAILRSYIVDGWFFALLHAALLVHARNLAAKIKSETVDLQAWSPGLHGKSECTNVLSQFIDECSHWGAHGILTPLTDFTDRLDARVQGMIDGLTGVVNLFLIVGVAGTFAGLFRFAYGMAVNLTTPNAQDPVRDIVGALTTGLAQAIPVSIFGIAFTIAGHFFISSLESKLRTALTQATQRALFFRRNANKSLADALREAMVPFQDIAKVMAENLRPVLEEVEKSATRISQTLAPFSQGVETFALATTHLATSLSAIEATMADSRQHLFALHQTRDQLTTKTADLLDRMERIEAIMARAATHMESLSSGLSASLQQNLTTVTREMHATWERLAIEMTGFQDQRLASLMNDLRGVNTRLSEAAQNFQEASVHAAALNREGPAQIIRQLLSEYETTLNDIREFLRNDIPPTLTALRTGVDEVHRLRQDTVAITQVHNTSTGRLADRMFAVADGLPKLTNTLERIETKLPKERPPWRWKFWRRKAEE